MKLSRNIWAVVQVGLCYVIIVFGQALWKLGITKLRVPEEPWLSFVGRYITSWYFIAGAGAYVLATIVWIYILSQYDFSLVYPMNSIGYAFAILLSILIFKETIPPTRYIGILIIIAGIFVLSLK